MSKGLQKSEKPRPLGHRVFQSHRSTISKNAKILSKLKPKENGKGYTDGEILRLSIEQFNPHAA